jgi:hypothetical protein
MTGLVYLRERDGEIDFEVVMKFHKKGTDTPTFRARVAGGRLCKASIKKLREASHRTWYVSKKHDYAGYIKKLIRLGFEYMGPVRGFVEEVPNKAADYLETYLMGLKIKKSILCTWFNNR